MKLHHAILASLLLATACTSKYPYPPQFVSPGTMHHYQLPQPPYAGSAEFNRELAYIKAEQKKLSRHERETIVAENHIEPEMIVTPVLGKGVTRERYPHLYELLKHAASDSWRLADANQDTWRSPRPWMADEEVELIAPKITSYGYPSGHTTTNRVWAHILSGLFPGKEHAFFARAEQIARHRVEGGVHFPHDVEGGRKLASAIYTNMKQNPEFRAELAEARREVRRNYQAAEPVKAAPVAKPAKAETSKAATTAPKKEKTKAAEETTPRSSWWKRL